MIRILSSFLLAQLCITHGAHAQQARHQLPLDASNCAILQALAPSQSEGCKVLSDNGQTRGIVLRLDEQLNDQQNQDLGQTIRPIPPVVQAIVSRPRTSATTTPTAGVSLKTNHAAAKSTNGYFIQFAFGSFDLEPDFQDHMKRLTSVLSTPEMAKTCIRVTGHTDTVGSAGYNKALSERRAIIVAGFLADNGRISPMRIQMIAAGETKPLPDITGDDPLNRRVEFSTKEMIDDCNS